MAGIRKNKVLICVLLLTGIFLGYTALKEYKKFYAKITYPDGTIKKTVLFLPSKNVYQIKEFYPNGSLERLCYLDYNDNQVGEQRRYLQDGKLKSINVFETGEMYFKKVYFYDGKGNLVDSAETLLPIIHEFRLNKTGDTAVIVAQMLLDGTKYKYGDLDMYYEVYDTINPDGMYPYPPTDSTKFNGPGIKTLLFPIDLISRNPDKFYLVAVIRENVGSVKELHEIVEKEIGFK